ncbi:MAG TPA: bifunctional methylenetetrahydrofolate dehydrogenase/methenyltetrahydrofolate cyclohydrolase FolD [Aggregatilineales bacterium]|nr:bifunctional methylenetetrahydrofolate dehydrogenase/methenyltetrahydrofolate cyclohydrolase FolD [Aggregatilineales bacterium]
MLIDGKAVAARIRGEIAQEVKELIEKYGIKPGLATVLVGDDPASHSYVRSKRKACAELGIESFHHELPAETPQAELEVLVHSLNEDPTVHGILIQLPLPDHVNEKEVLDLISFGKDADGFHPTNVGLLAMKGRDPAAIACTPHGVMVLLKETGVEISGKRAVVLGRSNIVGMPVALLLIHANATVTIAHSRTPDLPVVCREADILVAAVGRAQMVKADWVKPGAVVIDVGVNRVDDPEAERGYRLVGDVDTDAVKDVASAITPVPGGVGPMTIAMLMKNTVELARASLS